jgi:hypothetical protein
VHESEAGKSKIGASRLEQPVRENAGGPANLGIGCSAVLAGGVQKAFPVRPNVRAKLAPTAGRAGQVGENVQGTADLARVARRWGST